MNISELKLTDKRKSICNRLGFESVEDILSYYPFKYDELYRKHFYEFKDGENIFFEAELISSPSTYRYAFKRSVTRFKVLYEGEEIQVSIFNRPWLKFLKQNTITIYGKYEGNNKVTAYNYYEKNIDDIEGIIPTYSLKEGINQNEIKKLIEIAYKALEDKLVDEVPSKLINDHKLISYNEAIYNIHFPKNKDLLLKAISRLKYDEFLRFYLALNILRENTTADLKKAKNIDDNKINEFINSFNYEFTDDQITSINDLLNDLKSNKVMYRLLQGEVGSGKTVVSMISLYANYLAGYQGALMVPTEILAKQHFDSFVKAFKNFNVNVEVLYSALNNKDEIKSRLLNGEIDIIIGTHALFQSDVEFRNLGLVVADEQHRFGVKQRRALKEKGDNVDLLLMSATPIPRTLASSLYGDMDVSTIETLPKGRKGCKTYLINSNSIVGIIDDIKDKLKEGRQLYIIAAAIEANENYKAKDVTNLYNSLKDGLAPYKVGFLHGKLSSEEKEKVMNDFNLNNIQVLVSTTVVEVGVNVINASLMVIYDADKFGLSQLHQLRGRIQRGNVEGLCYLLTSSKDKDVLDRLNVLVKSNNGFDISMKDLKLRGPGDILGTRQSGLPAFSLGNLLEDTKFIDSAKKDARWVVNHLEMEENALFYAKIASNAKKNAID